MVMTSPPTGQTKDPEVLRFYGFLVVNTCFAVAADGVSEVLRGGRLTSVPRASAAIAGLLHLRGRIVPVIDLRLRLGFPPAAHTARRTHLVLRLQDDWYSLLVDAMLDVIEIPADRIEHPTAPVTDPSADAMTGIFAGNDQLVHLLDPQRIVQSLVQQRVRGHSTG